MARILIVDTDWGFTRSVAGLLQTLEPPYEVLEAMSNCAALSAIRQQGVPDVLIADEDACCGNQGLELVRELQSRSQCPPHVIIFTDWGKGTATARSMGCYPACKTERITDLLNALLSAP